MATVGRQVGEARVTLRVRPAVRPRLAPPVLGLDLDQVADYGLVL